MGTFVYSIECNSMEAATEVIAVAADLDTAFAAAKEHTGLDAVDWRESTYCVAAEDRRGWQAFRRGSATHYTGIHVVEYPFLSTGGA